MLSSTMRFGHLIKSYIESGWDLLTMVVLNGKGHKLELKKQPGAARRMEQTFAGKWCRHDIIASRGGTDRDVTRSLSPRWILLGPWSGFVFEFS